MVVLGSLAEFQIDISLTTPNKKSDHGKRSIWCPLPPQISAEPRQSYLMVLTGPVSFEPKTSYRKRLSIPINRLFIIRKLIRH
jgi:hypothetical protein